MLRGERSPESAQEELVAGLSVSVLALEPWMQQRFEDRI